MLWFLTKYLENQLYKTFLTHKTDKHESADTVMWELLNITSLFIIRIRLKLFATVDNRAASLSEGVGQEAEPYHLGLWTDSRYLR